MEDGTTCSRFLAVPFLSSRKQCSLSNAHVKAQIALESLHVITCERERILSGYTGHSELRPCSQPCRSFCHKDWGWA